MTEAWYAILWFMLTSYVVLDGKNLGAGTLHWIVAKSATERRQLIAAIGPLWTWHEVWLVASGGVLFVAFPRVMAAAFSGYYLALFMVLWSLVLRGISIEVGGHLSNRLWQSFWNFIFAVSNYLLAALYGVALGNLLRGLPLGPDGEIQMALFTDFRVAGHVGLLDWFTASVGICSLLVLAAHGATYLTFKTEGPVHERSRRFAPRLWAIASLAFVAVVIETRIVRPELFAAARQRPLAWAALLIALAGAASVFIGIRRRRDGLAFAGSCLLIAGLLAERAVAMFPCLLYSTLGAENSLTLSNAASSSENLSAAMIWWPVAFVLSISYWFFIVRHFRDRVTPSTSAQAPY